MKLSIIIPVYNEERTIEKVVERVKTVKIGKLKKEIIVVNDGSTDKTLEILRKIRGIILINKKNGGKGSAIKAGIKKISGEIIIIQDADMEYDPLEIPKIIKPILEKKTKIVYGSRFLGKNMGKKILLHDFGNFLLSFFTSIIFNSKITDMETGRKAFTIDTLKGIRIKSEKFDFEPEITAKFLKKKHSIKEVPIIFNARTFKDGKKIRTSDGIIALFMLLKYKITD